MKKTEKGHLSWKNKEPDGCDYFEDDGTCSHPSKTRGTKGDDGKMYCRARDAEKANKKTG